MFSLFKRSDSGESNPPGNTGRAGEEIAAAYLRRLGWKLVERNYRKRFGEIDIIAEDDDVLVFVEVKTRSYKRFGSPLEAVDARKQHRMIRAAQSYLSESGSHDRPARFDVVAIMLQNVEKPELEHIRNAFELLS